MRKVEEDELPPHVTQEGDLPPFPPNPQFYYQQDGSGAEDGEEELHGHVFQQSVTLTAKMWYEGNETDDSGASFGWKWASWRVPTEYLPLLVALCCGIAIVLLTISALIVWRCCLLPRRKQDYCDGSFCEGSSQNGLETCKNTARDTAVYALQNGPWTYHSRVLTSNDSLYTVPRSQTMVSMPRRTCSVHDGRCKRRCERPSSQSIAKEVTMVVPAVMSQFQPSVSYFSGEYRRELSPSSSLEGGLDDPLCYSDRSKSTPALEDLYSKQIQDGAGRSAPLTNLPYGVPRGSYVSTRVIDDEPVRRLPHKKYIRIVEDFP